MPSHSPYALSSLTFFKKYPSSVLELHKFRVFFEIDFVYPFWKNLLMFPQFLASIHLRGLTIISNHLPLWLLSIIVVALFSFQGAISSVFSDVVEMRRIELLTPCLQGRCSPSWATPPFRFAFKSSLCNTSLKLTRCTIVLSSSLCLVLQRLPITLPFASVVIFSLWLSALLPENCSFS